jgi:hypothetical protein
MRLLCPNLHFGACGPATSRWPWSFLCKIWSKNAHEELPTHAQLAFGVNRYVAQTANGGHTQFYNNTRRQSTFLHTVRSGLEACGAQPYLQIFDEFCALLDSKDDVIPTDPLATTHPEIKKLDDRFYSLDPYKTLMGAISDWVRQLPEFRSVPDGHYQEALVRDHTDGGTGETRMGDGRRAPRPCSGRPASRLHSSQTPPVDA